MAIQYNPTTNGRGIEWTDATVNPIGGCMHACRWEMPDGTTAICYAEEVAENGPAAAAYPHGFAHHYWRETQFKQLTSGKEPLLIFIDSMSDMFAANVPEDQVRRVLKKIGEAPHHAYQSLTKAAPQLLKYVNDIPPNLWVGVSSPPDWFMGKRLSRDQQAAMLRRSLDVLRQVRERTGNITWMSAEPVSWELCAPDLLAVDHPLDWVVIGAASSGRQYFQPDWEHVRNLLQLFDATNTPVFFKGNIKQLLRDVTDMMNTMREATGKVNKPVELLRWREDFPATYRSGEPIAAVCRRTVLAVKNNWTVSRDYFPSKVQNAPRRTVGGESQSSFMI